MKSNKLLHIFFTGMLLIIPAFVSAAGWGTPISSSDEGVVVLPAAGSYSSNQQLSSPNGWGNADSLATSVRSGSAVSSHSSMDISPSKKMIDNPWFQASDFLPNPDEYKAPPAEEKESIEDSIMNPEVIWVETVEKDGKTLRSNFKALYINEEVFVPVITLPRMFKTRVQWKALEQKLFIHKGPSSLTFSLDEGLKVDFFGDDTSFGERLIYYQKMLFVPVRAISEFFKYKVFWSSARKLLHFIERSDPSPALQKKWDDTLKKNNLYGYANDLKTGRSVTTVPQTGTAASSSTNNRVFHDIWGTSEEPQTIACKGLRGDWKLRSSDMAIALPSREALMKKVYVRYRKTGKIVKVTVVDVGPWNIDDPYWVKDGGRPEAEQNTQKFYSRGYNKTNLAGIDLAYEVWVCLGVSRSVAHSGNFSAFVDWWFE
jgi:hypothetical protein